jgi:hypothetical protein
VSTVNKHGLRRAIPEEVKRLVRQNSGFGCVLCGLSLYHYDHIDPPFKEAQAHRPEDICLLCPDHHERKGKPAHRGLRWLRLGDLDRQFQKLDQQAKAMKKRAGPALKVTPPPRSSRSHPPTVKRPDLSRAVVEVGGK